MRIAPPEFHLARLGRLRDRLGAESIAGLIVTASPNVAYLTGFFGSAGIFVATAEGGHLVVDGRYSEAAAARGRELEGIDIVSVPQGGTYDETVGKVLRSLAGARVGFEASHLTVQAHRDLAREIALQADGVELVATEGIVERLRVTKDDWEVGRLREAGARLSDVANSIIPKALVGISEGDLAGLIERDLRRVGFAKPAFDTIVASGPNSAMPHYRSGERRLAPGDLVVLDFGGVLDGYCVDLTRTVAIGAADPRQRQVLEHVMAAQAAAFHAVVPGHDAAAVDESAREHLVREGLGEAFTHGTGHGLGLEVHERPRVGPRRAGRPQETLEAGMVLTLEPGAYFPGWGGVRIEDDVLVTARGAEWLTHAPRLA